MLKPTTCLVRRQLEHDCYALVNSYSSATSSLVALADSGRSTAYWATYATCRRWHADLQNAKDQLATHQARHQCGGWPMNLLEAHKFLRKAV